MVIDVKNVTVQYGKSTKKRTSPMVEKLMKEVNKNDIQIYK